ncbi:MAG TPA: nitrilase-related carbon-nitrogen hydrolase [Planctomycetaceae bacterium]|nr:nitrilase-related carbon-nitrogen hydrolase [Planctomycetaceae bacterium]
MHSFRIAAVSMNGRLGQPGEILEEIESWTGKAVHAGAQLVLFPELVVHGHCTPNTWDIAEPIPEGPATRRLCEIAARHKIVLSAGMSEKEHDIVFNAQVLVGPKGFIGKQRKIHLSRDEVLIYKGGRELPVFDMGLCKIGTVICYDNSFPEPARILALRGAEVLLMPHAARHKTWDDSADSERQARAYASHYYRTMMPCRARENACFAVAADQVGRAGYVERYPRESPAQPHHPGGAFACDPHGQIIEVTQDERIAEEMIVADLDVSALHAARSDPNFTLRTRRPELFGELVKEQVSW